MQIKCFDNYVYTRLANLDLNQQKQNAYLMHDFIQNHFQKVDEKYRDIVAPSVSKKFNQYNYLLYPYIGMHKLYTEIKDFFYSLEDHPFKEYFVQCWLNVYTKDQYIDWHAHWPKEFYSWHGFYCIDVEPDSYTLYRVNEKEIRIDSQNNLFVISRSGEDIHRSSDWQQDYPRITVAFDIVPAQMLQQKHINDVNHWIPI